MGCSLRILEVLHCHVSLLLEGSSRVVTTWSEMATAKLSRGAENMCSDLLCGLAFKLAFEMPLRNASGLVRNQKCTDFADYPDASQVRRK